MKRVVLAALVAISVGAPPSVGATERTPVIQPGAQFCVPPVAWDDRPCGTLGFVLRTQDGRLYITVPAHGVDKEDETGEPFRVYTGYGGPFPYGSSQGFGDVVIDDDSHDEKGADVALVLIDKDKRDYVSPAVLHWTGPSGVLGNVGAFGDRVYTYGVKPDPDRTYGPQEGQLLTRTPNNFNSTLQFNEGPGASGSPYLYAADGSALGVNGNCLCGTGFFGYPTLDYVIRRFRAVPTYDSLQLVTAKYQPPATAS